MITDPQTNTVYFSTLLKASYPQFWSDLEAILKRHSIKYRWIHKTRDIWCRDFMPIQLAEDRFVQFKFFPDYYLNYDDIGLLTIQNELQYNLSGSMKVVDLFVDGGNVVKSKKKAILTEKVFKENKNREKKVILRKIKDALEVEKIVIIPTQPDDHSGHADGMVRFYDEDTILVNEFDESTSWMYRFDRAINVSGLKAIPLPYQYSTRRNYRNEYTAHGCYINFAQIGNLIVFPQFGEEFSDTDKRALERMHDLYPASNYRIEQINADSIAWHGGVLNCCTWNISISVIKDAINKIIPVYWSQDSILVVLENDYVKRPFRDALCIKLSLGISSGYLGPFSLEKQLKFGYWENRASSQEEISELRKKICLKYDEIDISEIYFKLLNPSLDIISELAEIPDRSKK